MPGKLPKQIQSAKKCSLKFLQERGLFILSQESTEIKTSLLIIQPIWTPKLIGYLTLRLRKRGIYLGTLQYTLPAGYIEPIQVIPITTSIEKAKAISKIIGSFSKKANREYEKYVESCRSQRGKVIKLSRPKISPKKWLALYIHTTLKQIIDEI